MAAESTVGVGWGLGPLPHMLSPPQAETQRAGTVGLGKGLEWG